MTDTHFKHQRGNLQLRTRGSIVPCISGTCKHFKLHILFFCGTCLPIIPLSLDTPRDLALSFIQFNTRSGYKGT